MILVKPLLRQKVRKNSMGDQILLLISYMLIFCVSLMFVGLGGMFSERSGVINIGLEGIMVMGGFIGLLGLNLLTGANLPPAIVVIGTILFAIIGGMLYSLLLAVVCINFKADQTLVGTALNLIATAVALTLTKTMSGGSSTVLKYTNEYFVYHIGENTSFTFNIFLFIGLVVLIASFIVLYKTRFGLRLRSCGENPAASDSVGINVVKYRYAGVLISGALGGIGALAYIVPLASTWNATSGVAGFGFLALAIMIFGQRKPIRIAIVSLIFSFFLSLSYVYSGIFSALGIELTAENGVTSELFRLIPFLVSLIILVFSSRKSRAPKAEGIPYDKSTR